MDRNGILAEQIERFWHKWILIGRARGIRFTRTALGEGWNLFVLERIS